MHRSVAWVRLLGATPEPAFHANSSVSLRLRKSCCISCSCCGCADNHPINNSRMREDIFNRHSGSLKNIRSCVFYLFYVSNIIMTSGSSVYCCFVGITCVLASKWHSVLHKKIYNWVLMMWACTNSAIIPQSSSWNINPSRRFVSSKQKCHSTYSSRFYVGYYDSWSGEMGKWVVRRLRQRVCFQIPIMRGASRAACGH